MSFKDKKGMGSMGSSFKSKSGMGSSFRSKSPSMDLGRSAGGDKPDDETFDKSATMDSMKLGDDKEKKAFEKAQKRRSSISQQIQFSRIQHIKDLKKWHSHQPIPWEGPRF